MQLCTKVHTTVHRTDRRPQSFGEVDVLETVVEIIIMFDVYISVGHL
jgi:hypothetical protein